MKMPTMAEVVAEEATLQFTKFDNQTALAIGNQLVALAQERHAAVTIDITRCRQQLFHAALPGTAIDNDEWLKRKINVVYQFGVSSLHKQLEMTAQGRSIEEASLVNKYQFAAAGGCFPVVLKDTGLIGTIAVSGMASEEDHQLIVDELTAFLTPIK
ncbi:hypothetical protein AYR62_14725 [Secundilactobacillus paracollinoides]|uniref:heme-degrading domain-containing protein n=1 Tax=Secundilactobacillus paracollinoides TaxID=240427 RepID=UPI00081A468C|nr:heme-degrading domain-containing protein [Secundilactobacillus paracollinoides]ANZ65209.1 hypothetical protein AYR62_14725 [Secundilactobacillus paracollinoides]